MPSTWKVVSNMLTPKLSGRNSRMKYNRVFFALHWYVFKFFKSYPRKKSQKQQQQQQKQVLHSLPCALERILQAPFLRRSSLRRARGLSLGLPLHSHSASFTLRPLLAELLEFVAHFKQQHWEDVNAE